MLCLNLLVFRIATSILSHGYFGFPLALEGNAWNIGIIFASLAISAETTNFDKRDLLQKIFRQKLF
jgi:hypothetical protein